MGTQPALRHPEKSTVEHFRDQHHGERLDFSDYTFKVKDPVRRIDD